MPSYYFKIEAYGNGNYGCPMFGLMGYTNINELIDDCWDYYHAEHAEDIEDTSKNEEANK